MANQSPRPEVAAILGQQCLILFAIALSAVAVNLPLGYLREGTARFSGGWFLYVHLSVPLIAFLRIRNHVSLWAIPPFIACAIVGQVLGGRVRRRFGGLRG